MAASTAAKPQAGPRPPETAATISHQGVGAARFAQSLLHLSSPNIGRLVARLNARRTSPDDDVAWWEATTSLNRTLRHRGIGHQAAMAAHLASQAMLAAATRTGLALSPDVLAVARSAGEVARVLVAGDMNTTGAGYLARGWEEFLLPPADSPTPPGPPAGKAGRRHEPRRTNKDPNGVHSVTAKDRSFSVDVPPQSSVTLTVAKAGTYPYYCQYHSDAHNPASITVS